VKSQHLSDEAIAAFADGVLVSHAHTRAARHTSECPECAYAVTVQREAIWAMRAAPAPALPTSLLERLRDVPAHTPLQGPPDAVAPDGTGAFAAFGTAALVPPTRDGARPDSARTRGQQDSRGHGVIPIIATVAAVAAAGALAVGSAAAVAGSAHRQPSQPATARQVGGGQYGPALFAPASWSGHRGR
jgi:hypothetical protein